MRVLVAFYLACVLQISNASIFGTEGNVATPSARLHSDGMLTATIAATEIVDIFNITYQAAPRIQTTFRYSIFNPRELPSSRDTLRDRSYGVKALLLSEKRYRPAVALGVRDILGTGVWEGEYLVASKKWGALDLSLGLGWGRLGTVNSFDNPLAILGADFSNRFSGRRSGGQYGGEWRSKSFFRGTTSFFGGLQFSSSSGKWRAAMEFQSDDYSREIELRTIRVSPINFGWCSANRSPEVFQFLNGAGGFGLMLSTSLDTKNTSRKNSKALAWHSRSKACQSASTLDFNAPYDRLMYDREIRVADALCIYKAKAVRYPRDREHWVCNDDDSIQKACPLQNSTSLKTLRLLKFSSEKGF